MSATQNKTKKTQASGKSQETVMKSDKYSIVSISDGGDEIIKQKLSETTKAFKDLYSNINILNSKNTIEKNVLKERIVSKFNLTAKEYDFLVISVNGLYDATQTKIADLYEEIAELNEELSDKTLSYKVRKKLIKKIEKHYKSIKHLRHPVWGGLRYLKQISKECNNKPEDRDNDKLELIKRTFWIRCHYMPYTMIGDSENKGSRYVDFSNVSKGVIVYYPYGKTQTGYTISFNVNTKKRKRTLHKIQKMTSCKNIPITVTICLDSMVLTYDTGVLNDKSFNKKQYNTEKVLIKHLVSDEYRKYLADNLESLFKEYGIECSEDNICRCIRKLSFYSINVKDLKDGKLDHMTISLFRSKVKEIMNEDLKHAKEQIKEDSDQFYKVQQFAKSFNESDINETYNVDDFIKIVDDTYKSSLSTLIKSSKKAQYDDMYARITAGKIQGRIVSIDMNPEKVGVAIMQKANNSIGFKLIKAFTIKWDFYSKKLHLPSNSEKQKEQNNRRAYEIYSVLHYVFRMARYYKCSDFVCEDLESLEAAGEHGNRKTNRKINNLWHFSIFENKPFMLCTEYGLRYNTVNAAYSSFIGNIQHHEYFDDPTCAAVELGRRFLARQHGTFYPPITAKDCFTVKEKFGVSDEDFTTNTGEPDDSHNDTVKQQWKVMYETCRDKSTGGADFNQRFRSTLKQLPKGSYERFRVKSRKSKVYVYQFDVDKFNMCYAC